MPRSLVRVAVALALAVPALTVVGQGPASDVPALLDRGDFEHAEELARTNVATLRAATSSTGPLTLADAIDALVVTLVVNGRAAADEAVALARESLALRERELGPADQLLVPTLSNLADVLTARGEFETALAIAGRAVGVSHADSAERALALDRLGRALSSARRLDEALQALNESLELRERLRATEDAALVSTIEELTLVLQRKGEYRRARDMLRRAEAAHVLLGTERPAYITTLNLQAQQLWFEGDLRGSGDASRRAVSLAERTLRPGHPTTALSLRYLADTTYNLGASAEAYALTARALAVVERNFGPSSHLTAEYVSDLGIVELDLGNYEAARALLQRALGKYEARYGKANDLVASTLSGLARANARLGDYAAANRDQSRAVTIFTQTGGPNHPYVALSLTRLAMVFSEENQPLRAVPLLERALTILERNLGPEHRDVARTLADLASALAAVGQVARAQQLATRAVRIWESIAAPDAPEFATVLALYADLQARRGDLSSARDYHNRSLAIRRKVFGPDNPIYAEGEVDLASVLARLGDPQAQQTAVEAERKGRDHLRLMLRSLPERQALQYAASRPRGLNLMLSLSPLSPLAADAALDGLVRGRALVLDEMAARRGIGHAQGEETGFLRQTLATAQQRLANLLVRGPGTMSAAQYATLVDEARQESETAERALADRSASYRAERGRAQLGATDVIDALPEDGALVAFARYARTPLPGGTTSGSQPRPAQIRDVPSYLAFVVRRGSAPAVVSLGTEAVIDELVATWRADITLPTGSAADDAELAAEARRAGVALRQRVWDRLASHLGSARRVFIVPDGSLALVPFAALPVGQRSYLLERGPVIHYLSAERDLAMPAANGVNAGGLLALGGASFDDRSVFTPGSRTPPARTIDPATGASARRGETQPCSDLGTMRFTNLLGTRQEVREVSAAWPTGDGEVRTLVGRQADERSFKRAAPGHRVLHVATHGFFLDGPCVPGVASTRGVGGLTSARPSRPGGNPLRLSGLALAGANRRAAAGPDDDDGILTAEEVASLDLGGVEWAVLSACDTGVGEIRAGEGVFGLRRAFQVAGARTVIMSLWSVDDQATRAWMRALYEGRLQQGLSTADAVHQASLRTLRARRAGGLGDHPFYWAAFVAAGDWR